VNGQGVLLESIEGGLKMMAIACKKIFHKRKSTLLVEKTSNI
jgi:hypothetical protein